MYEKKTKPVGFLGGYSTFFFLVVVVILRFHPFWG